MMVNLHRNRTALRLPGRIYEQFAAKAEWHLDHDSDVDLCDGLSRARAGRRGTGYTLLIPLDYEQVLRLAEWVTASDPKPLRDYADAMRKQAAAAIEVESV